MPLTKVQIGMTDAPTSGTAVTASGTSVDFTGIPSTAKRITVMFSGVSTNGGSIKLVQIGAGSVLATGYNGVTSFLVNASSAGGLNSSAGFPVYANSATDTLSGHMVLTLINSNVWVSSHVGKSRSDYTCFGGGDVSLSGALDRVRITTVNGTDTFDAGTINILYE
jgi:hypothetical protein